MWRLVAGGRSFVRRLAPSHWLPSLARSRDQRPRDVRTGRGRAGCRRAQGNTPLGSLGRRQRRLKGAIHGGAVGFVGWDAAWQPSLFLLLRATSSPSSSSLCSCPARTAPPFLIALDDGLLEQNAGRGCCFCMDSPSNASCRRRQALLGGFHRPRQHRPTLAPARAKQRAAHGRELGKPEPIKRLPTSTSKHATSDVHLIHAHPSSACACLSPAIDAPFRLQKTPALDRRVAFTLLAVPMVWHSATDARPRCSLLAWSSHPSTVITNPLSQIPFTCPYLIFCCLSPIFRFIARHQSIRTEPQSTFLSPFNALKLGKLPFLEPSSQACMMIP